MIVAVARMQASSTGGGGGRYIRIRMRKKCR
jgi:hypothetical protein